MTATDPDAGSMLSWSVSVWGTGAAAALVVSAAGVVSVLTPPNFEAQASFTLTAVCGEGVRVRVRHL